MHTELQKRVPDCRTQRRRAGPDHGVRSRPELTVTVEDRNGVPDLHVHAGSQGVWQARMITSLGVRVSLVAALCYF